MVRGTMSCGSILLYPCLSRNVIHSPEADKTARDTHVQELQTMLLIRTSQTCRPDALVVPSCEEANEGARTINGALGNGTINISAKRDIDRIVMVRNPQQISEGRITYFLDRRVEMGVPPSGNRRK
jgi:hypothetical protein